MCLITSQFKAYKPTGEITAYKLVNKATNKENIYYSPFQGAIYDFSSKSSPIQLSTGKKEEFTSTNHGNKNSLGGGWLHALLNPSEYPLYQDKYVILRVTIPEYYEDSDGNQIDTVVYISDNMNEICANNMKIYDDVVDIDSAEVINLSSVPINFELPEGINISYSGNNINLTVNSHSYTHSYTLVTSSPNFNSSVQWAKVKPASDITSEFTDLPQSYNAAKQYFNGKNDTPIIKKLETTYEGENNNNICYEAITKLQDGEYLPSIGELNEIIQYQHYINYELKCNNSDKLIQNATYFSSTPYSLNNVWTVNTEYLTIYNYYSRQNKCLFLPVK